MFGICPSLLLVSVLGGYVSWQNNSLQISCINASQYVHIYIYIYLYLSARAHIDADELHVLVS